MKNNIKVSIIVPVYNTAKYLPQCLDSLKNQTLMDIEIICINDGSTDNSLEILKKYQKEDSRFIILSQDNHGQSTARNKGIKTAKGRFIGFVDSDDYIDTTMFERLCENAYKNDSDITMCSLKVFDDKTGQLNDSDPYMTLDLFPKSFNERVFDYTEASKFLFRICVTPWNKIYKRKFLLDKNILFPEGLFFEDNLFFYSTFLQAKKISLIRDKLYFYRKASETSTMAGHDSKKLDFFKVFDKIEEFLKEKNMYTEFEEYFCTHKKNTLIYWYKKLKNDQVKEEYTKKLNKQYADIHLPI